MPETFYELLATTATSAASSAAGEGLPFTGPLLHLLSAGICAFAIWLFFVFTRPGILSLAHTPGRQNRLNILHLVVLFLVFQGSLYGILAAQGYKIDPKNPPPMTAALPAQMAAQGIWAIASLAVASMTFRHGLRRGLGLTTRRWLVDLVRGVAAFLIVLPPIIGLLEVAQRLLPSRLIHPHDILQFLPQASFNWRLMAIFATVIVAPLAEELFFRGLLQSALRSYIGKPWISILISSALFMAVHGPMYQDMPSLFVLAVGLGYLYERTGRLLAPMVAHAVFNSAMLWLTLAR